jgi:ribosome-binding protein aMBF1 (putative translation factor)
VSSLLEDLKLTGRGESVTFLDDLNQTQIELCLSRLAELLTEEERIVTAAASGAFYHSLKEDSQVRRVLLFKLRQEVIEAKGGRTK